MSTLKLNIYKNQKEVEKTLVAESYDSMFGTVEEVLNVFDPDMIADKVAIATTICKCFKELKPILKEIFPEVTDDELKRVKVKELVPLFYEICKHIGDDIAMLNQGN